MTALGYYAIADRLATLPVNVIGNIIGRGVFAAMARVHDEPERLKRIWLENVQRLALLSVPAAIGVALVAEPLVVTLLGEDWRPAIVPIQLLAMKSVIGTFAATSGELFQALHRPQLRVVAEVAYLVLLVPALIVGARADGIDGAAAATLAVNGLLGSVLLVAMMRLLAVRTRELAHAVLPPAVGWALMTVAILVLRPIVDGLSPGVQLVILVAVGAAVYLLSVVAFARDVVVTMWVNLRGARTPG